MVKISDIHSFHYFILVLLYIVDGVGNLRRDQNIDRILESKEKRERVQDDMYFSHSFQRKKLLEVLQNTVFLIQL